MEPIKDTNGELESAVAALILFGASTALLYLAIIPWQVAGGAWIVALFLTLPNRMGNIVDVFMTVWKKFKSADAVPLESEEDSDGE